MSTAERTDVLERTLPLRRPAPVREAFQPARLPESHRRGWLVRRALAAGDIVGLSAAFFSAQLVFGDRNPNSIVSAEAELAVFLATLPVWVVIAKVYGLYDNDEERTDHSTIDEAVSVFHLVTVGAWLLLAVTWLSGIAEPDLVRIVAFWALAIVAISVARATARAFCRRRPAYVQNAVIVGAGHVGQLIAQKLFHHPEYGINLVGFVDAEPRERRRGLEVLPVLGTPDELPEIVGALGVERVIVAFTNEPHELTLALLRELKPLDLQIDIVPRLFEIVGPNVGMHTIEGLPLIGLPPLRLSRSSALLKRAMDMACSTAGLVVLSPFLLLISLLIRFDSAGPVLFRQVRMGADDRPFRILKFRTMVVDAEQRKRELSHLNIHAEDDPRMFKVPEDPRTTRIGRFLRRYSLDELPQLWNVLRGEMSLVGPRPLVLDEDCYVREWGRERLTLKPGITGPWQVLGASDIPFEEMLKLDYLYVTGWSLFGDVKLVIRTLPAVLRARMAH